MLSINDNLPFSKVKARAPKCKQVVKCRIVIQYVILSSFVSILKLIIIFMQILFI